jgi:hypothetical protein
VRRVDDAWMRAEMNTDKVKPEGWKGFSRAWRSRVDLEASWRAVPTGRAAVWLIEVTMAGCSPARRRGCGSIEPWRRGWIDWRLQPDDHLAPLAMGRA